MRARLKVPFYGLALSLVPGLAWPQQTTPCPPAQRSAGGGSFSVTRVETFATRRCTVTWTISFNAEVSLLTGVRYYDLTLYKSCGPSLVRLLFASKILNQTLADSCGLPWYFANLDAIAGLSGGALARRSAASTTAGTRPSGQAAQNLLIADVNGDGIADDIYLGATGIVVELLNSDGSTKSTNTFPAGFAPDAAFSTIASADFNRDGNVDLAVSDPGTPGSSNGGVAILLGNGDGTFQAPKYFPAGQNPSSLAAADFNGDGKIDLAAASSVGSTIAVLSGNGDGTFTTPVSYGNGGDSQATPAAILAIDLNGDNRPDLVVANQGFVTVPNSSISTLINTGSGFKPDFNAPFPLGLIPTALAYSDLNNDGKLDLVASSPSSSASIVLFGNGDGTFQPPGYYAAGNSAGSVAVVPLDDGTSLLVTTDQLSGNLWLSVVSPEGSIGAPPLYMIGGMPTGVAVADLNGDGQPDAVVTGGSSDVSVLLGQKSGQPGGPAGYSLGQPSPMPQAVAIGDLNNDGKPDVVVASTGQAGNPGLVSVLLGNGDGTLQPPNSTDVNPTAQSIALADLNDDGNLDAVVAAYGSQSSFAGTDPGGIVVLPGKGDGTFRTPQTITVSGLHPEAVAVADLNGDGIPDIAAVMVSNYLSGTTSLAVFLGKGGGNFQTARTFPLKSTAGQFSGIVIGDWNGDGKPDIAAVSQAVNASIDVLLGDGSGNFKEMATIPKTEDDPVYLATADINRDGKLDLVVAHCCGQSDATYLAGNGDGTFQAENQLMSGNSPMAVAVNTQGIYTTIVSADNGSAAVTAVSLAALAAINANVSAANGALTALAPSSIATMYGSNLATGKAGATTSTLPANLNGTTVTVVDSSGAQLAASLFYVSPGQVNYFVPAKTAAGEGAVVVANGDGVTGSAGVKIASVAPGLFATNGAGLAAGYAVIYHANGTQTVEQLFTLNSAGAVIASPISLGSGTDRAYLFLFGTGLRDAMLSTVHATIGGIDSPVAFAGPQGTFLGLDQVNIGPLPTSLAGSGKADIILSADGQAANTVNVTFK